ncbi:hypothetical protein [Photobacterium leiognathi]|uniref:hypothetical protein n=1 Tax=Photobacterium leiognathi TaxID=553611 RepID=UPI002981F202|nr:hypothetical protein [Photobacterium leiognathi]
MLSDQSKNYLNDVKRRIKNRQGKINIITTHPVPETYQLVFLNGSPRCIINTKELQGKNIVGSIVNFNGYSYKIIKRLFISNKILELHLDDVLPK